MRRAARVASVVGLSSLLAVLVAAPAAAFDLNGGCTLDLSSTDASGAALDGASGAPGGGQGGTQDDPFIVDWDGTVSWTGSSGSQVFMDHSWQVSVFGIPTPLRGGDPNDGGDTTADGSTGVSENAPIELTGVFNVSGDINGADGAHCDGSGWFKLNGNPLTTIPFWIAVVVAVAGLLLLLGARPTATVAAAAPGASAYEPPPVAPPSEPMP
jgi:hypothetical protein